MKYTLGQQVEFNTRFRNWYGAWVPARVVEIRQELDAQGPYNTMVIELYTFERLKLNEIEQKRTLRPLKSHWDVKLQEWVA